MTTTAAGDLPGVSTAPPGLESAPPSIGPSVTVPAQPAQSAESAVPAPAPAQPAESAVRAGEATSADATPADATSRPGALARAVWRVLDLRGQGLTGPGGVLLAVLVLAPGVALDWALGGSLGTASTVAFLVAAVAAPAAVRPRAMATAAVLPPLLFAGAVAFLAWAGGANNGLRELVLDVGTTLAVSAPTLFLGTAAALAVVVGRLVARLLRR